MSCQNMFPNVTEAVVNALGMQKDLCRNPKISEDWKMLTVVKMRKNWNKRHLIKRDCETMDFTLGKLVDLKYTPVVTEKTLEEDFHTFNMSSGSLRGNAGNDAVKGHLGANMDAVDTMSKVTLQMEEVNMDDIFQNFDNKKINERFLKDLTLKKFQKLTFVKQRVYNSGPVDIFSGATKGASGGGHVHKWFSAKLKGSKTNVGSFKIPANKIFAFGLKDFNIVDGCLEISKQRNEFAMLMKKVETRSVLRKMNEDGEIVEEILEDHTPKYLPYTSSLHLQSLGTEEWNLKYLANLPKATRCDLMEKLAEILEDREVLGLLEDALFQSSYGENDSSDSELVNSFMDAVGAPDVASAAHTMVYALEALPDDLPSLLVKSDPETLSVLNHLMDDLKEGGEAQPPESPPPLLQEEGALHWVLEFVFSTRNLEDLHKDWECPFISPHDLLGALYLSVKGLILMQSEEQPEATLQQELGYTPYF